VETAIARRSDRWLRVGAPHLADLRTFSATGRGITAAELLLYVEADLQLCGHGTVLFEEPRFEVAELAVALTRWTGDGTEPGHDFVHDPSSYEERGIIRIAHAEGGWAASSSLITRSTPAHPWPVVKDLIDTFVRDTHELTARCLVEVGWAGIEVSAALHDVFGLPLADAKTLVRRASDRTRELGTPRDQV
jgi:hypothetical protein